MEGRLNYTTELRHRQRLDTSVSYVLESLDRSISLQQAADFSCYSPAHFQALFADYLGETFFEYVSRNRLFLAASRLTNTHEKLLDIAALAGFSSQANFTRAFKDRFRLSPAKFRTEHFGDSFPPMNERMRCRKTALAPTLEQLPPRHLLMCTAQGYMSSRFDHTLWNAMTQLCDLLSGLKGQLTVANQAIYLARDIMDLTRLEQGIKMAAVEVLDGQIPDSIKDHSIHVSGGLYATFEHQGILPEQTLNLSLFDWLPSSDFSLDRTRPVLMRSQQISLTQFMQATATNHIGSTQCVLRDGLGLSLAKIGTFQVLVSIPISSDIPAK
ncbi:helix-turn-helix domain-containing protein [Arenicella xantha]|uniref:AraC family transcriptional regulator n=1 Tax=Arenicella xantha TaxID=644221 RepID=A0A395JLX9_9GAMM|nr:helix-turn-helix domain-containing protein [Arenicella xantha]RBP50614.1 AraC family transcriptional regulator [Arenicella xantha]